MVISQKGLSTEARISGRKARGGPKGKEEEARRLKNDGIEGRQRRESEPGTVELVMLAGEVIVEFGWLVVESTEAVAVALCERMASTGGGEAQRGVGVVRTAEERRNGRGAVAGWDGTGRWRWWRRTVESRPPVRMRDRDAYRRDAPPPCRLSLSPLRPLPLLLLLPAPLHPLSLPLSLLSSTTQTPYTERTPPRSLRRHRATSSPALDPTGCSSPTARPNWTGRSGRSRMWSSTLIEGRGQCLGGRQGEEREADGLVEETVLGERVGVDVDGHLRSRGRSAVRWRGEEWREEADVFERVDLGVERVESFVVLLLHR